MALLIFEKAMTQHDTRAGTQARSATRVSQRRIGSTPPRIERIPRPVSGLQRPSTVSGDLPGAQKQKIGSDCNFFAIRDCRVAPKRDSQPQNAAKTTVFGPRGAEKSPQSQKSCKDTEFFVFAMGSTAATGQIPRKTRETSWPATLNQK